MASKIFQFINITLILVNGFVYFAPKKPVTGLHSNTAGGFARIALMLTGLLVLHVLLVVIALYFNKNVLLKIITFVMIPVSLIFWYYLIPAIRL